MVKYKNIPEDFKYIQSTKQAFYFFDNIIVDGYEIKEGDWWGRHSHFQFL